MADHFVGLDLVGQWLRETFPNAYCHAGAWFVEWGGVCAVVDYDEGAFRVGLYRDEGSLLDNEPAWLATMSLVSDVIRTVEWATDADWGDMSWERDDDDDDAPVWCRECHAFVGQGCDG